MKICRKLVNTLFLLTILCTLPTMAQTPDLARALIDAAAAGNARQVASLLAAGADVKARDAGGRTALLAATQGNHVEAARLLIQAGSDVNMKDAIQDSPYLLAGARGHLEILRMTLAAGADLKSTNRFGGTALIPACHYGHVETVRELLNTAVDVDHVNNLGWTALLEAVILGNGGAAHTEIVRLLLAHKANPNIADRDGTTPLAHARRRGFQKMEALIRASGGR
jgi:ankyrin repeat protein